MHTRVTALANQKGGVGKTTTSVNLAACLAERGQNVLLIDLDPQANATSGLGVEKKEGRSLYGLLLGEESAEQLVTSTEIARLSLIPAEVNLAGAEIEIPRMERYLHRLQEGLKPLIESGRFDHILIDCPPSLGVLTMNALAAAHGLLIPLQSEYYALEGLSVIVRLVQQLRDSGANPNLEIEGIVMTMYDNRTSLSRQVWQQVREYFEDKVYDTLIPRTVRLSEAPSHGKPIIVYDGNCTGAAAYRHLAKEFLARRASSRPAPALADHVDRDRGQQQRDDLGDGLQAGQTNQPAQDTAIP